MQQDLRALHPHLVSDPHAMYSVPVAPSSPAAVPHVAGGRVVVPPTPTHTVRAVYADAYESLRLGHPAAVLEEMLYFRPGLARQCDSNGVTLLHWACYYRSDPGVLEVLLRVNPDAARRASQVRPRVCFRGFFVCVSICSFSRSSFGQNDGCLPLHVAASWGCSVTIIALLFSAFPVRFCLKLLTLWLTFCARLLLAFLLTLLFAVAHVFLTRFGAGGGVCRGYLGQPTRGQGPPDGPHRHRALALPSRARRWSADHSPPRAVPKGDTGRPGGPTGGGVQ